MIDKRKEFIIKSLISNLEDILKYDVNTDKWLKIEELIDDYSNKKYIKVNFNMDLEICAEWIEERIKKNK